MQVSNRFRGYMLPGLLLGMALLGVISLCIGAVYISPSDTIKMFLAKIPIIANLVNVTWPDSYEQIVWFIRLPRIVLAMIVGACLAVAGAIFQGLFRNPMADPYVIGASSGAALGATASMVLAAGWQWMGMGAVPVTAFIGALGTVLLVYRIARTGSLVPIQSLLLAGIAISALLSSLVSLLMYLGDDRLHAVVYWLMGGLSGRSWEYVTFTLPYLVIGLLLALYCARDLNIMLMGEESAQHLGIEVERAKKILLVAASILTATAVSASGIVGFVGLIVPHVVRMITGPNHLTLIPISALTGAILILVADLAARTVMAPVEIPLGVVTSLFGAPFFIYLLRRYRRSFFT